MVWVCSTYWRNRSLKKHWQENLEDISALGSTDVESLAVFPCVPRRLPGRYPQKVTTAPFEITEPPFVIIVTSLGDVMLAITTDEMS